MNKYLVRYNVNSIPNDNIDMGQMFEFTYESEEYDLEEIESEILEYLCEYFSPHNFNIEEIIKM